MKSSGRLPLFYKDKKGKWQLFPIKDFSYENGKWWITYTSYIGCSPELEKFIKEYSGKLRYSINKDSYYLKED
jgi:hypothetical protein